MGRAKGQGATRGSGKAKTTALRKRRRKPSTHQANGDAIYVQEEEILKLAETLLRQIELSFDLLQPEIAKGVKLTWPEVKGILNPDSQGRRRLTLRMIKHLVIYGRDMARKTKDEAAQRTLFDLTNRILQEVQAAFLDPGDLTETEHAFVSNLKVNAAAQVEFSKQYAGCYALLRFTESGSLAVARMDLRPMEPGSAVCRFTTMWIADGTVVAEDLTEGYIYIVPDPDLIYAIGRPVGSAKLRSSILVKHRDSNGKPTPDLIGLRLNDSKLDSGPFCHRLFCRRLSEPPTDPEALERWNSSFQVWEDPEEAAKLLVEFIPKIDAILKLLRRSPKRPNPWGVRLP